jgi:hypothetical protein
MQALGQGVTVAGGHLPLCSWRTSRFFPDRRSRRQLGLHSHPGDREEALHGHHWRRIVDDVGVR